MTADSLIMLVEDSAFDLELIEFALQTEGVSHRRIVARDGVAALDYLHSPERSPAELPAIIVLDLRLPRVDGLEVLKRVRSNPQTQYIPIIILTSSDEDQDIESSYRFGANGYVQKPTGLAELQHAIHALVRYWLETNTPVPTL